MGAAPAAFSQQKIASAPLTYIPLTVAAIVERTADSLQSWGIAIPDAAATPAPRNSLWKDPAAHPVVLALLLLDRYTAECLEWDPEVLQVTLQRDGYQLSNAVWTKVQAMRVLLQAPTPWRQWDVFHYTCKGLSGVQPNVTYLEEPELGQLMLGADIMRLIDPTRAMGSAVEKFVAAALKHEGSVIAPAPLEFAERELLDPQLHCLDCSALHRDDHDVRCVSCGGSRLEPVPYEHEALRKECIALWAARHLLPIDQALEDLPETGAGNLVYHLLVHWDYARASRARLLQQLRTLA